MKLIKEHMKEIIFCIIELAIGILLLINPVSFTSAIIILAGVGVGSAGLLCVYKYFRLDAVEARRGNLLTFGLIGILIGVFCVVRLDWFIATFPILTVIYGIFMLLTGISKIQLMVDMLRMKSNKWGFAGFNALVSIICAIVILSSPFETTAVLWIFAGVSLIIEAVLDIVTMLLGYIVDKDTKEDEDSIVPVDIIEDDLEDNKVE